MKTFLKPHNVEPVKKALSAFNAGEQRVALAHATGTGKSYATCAIIELGNFKNVLYLSPSNHINKYFEKVVIKNLGDRKAISILATYCFLLRRDLKALAGKYDLIVLDEYHRIGAKEWGKAVKEVLELNPQAKILGLTATEVRYCDNWKDMSKELNFNVVSRITLVDAIEHHILPAPEYIIGFSDFDRIITELEALATKYNADEEYLEEIKKIKVDWINSDGLAGIVKRHLPITTSKIVVFSEAIERYEDIVKKLTEILTSVGFKNLKFLRADSDTRESMKNIEYFSTNNNKNEVKVIISVNMLNEGIHAEGAEACFMFRKTKSANIFLQQLGRVESSLNPEERPVVFDLVANINNDWELFTKIGLRQNGETIRISHDCIKRIFGKVGIGVTSYVERVEELKEKLNRLYNNHNNYTVQNLIDFVNDHNRLPKSTVENEKPLYYWMYRQIKLGNKEVIEIFEKYKTTIYVRVTEYSVKQLLEFVNTYNRLPNRTGSREERLLYYWMYRQIKLGNKEVIEIFEKYRDFKAKSPNPNHTTEEFKKFVEQKGGLPSSSIQCSEYERGLNAWMYYKIKQGDQEIISLYKKYKKKYITLEDLKSFVELHNRLPNGRSISKFERKLYAWMRIQLHRGNQEVIDIYNRFNPDKPWKG